MSLDQTPPSFPRGGIPTRGLPTRSEACGCGGALPGRPRAAPSRAGPGPAAPLALGAGRAAPCHRIPASRPSVTPRPAAPLPCRSPAEERVPDTRYGLGRAQPPGRGAQPADPVPPRKADGAMMRDFYYVPLPRRHPVTGCTVKSSLSLFIRLFHRHATVCPRGLQRRFPVVKYA